MLTDILILSLIVLFLFAFRGADRYYDKATEIAEIEYKKHQLFSDKFMRAGLRISQLRTSQNVDFSALNEAMQTLDELTAEYVALEEKEVQDASKPIYGYEKGL